MARRDTIAGPVTRVDPLSDAQTTSLIGVPDGFSMVTQPTFALRTILDDPQHHFANLHSAHLWHKGLHADLWDGHHWAELATLFQPLCGFLTELCEDEDAAIDHGLVTGLADDDHTQYLLASGTVVDNAVPVYVGTGGRTLEDTPVTIDPITGNVAGIDDLNVGGGLDVSGDTVLGSGVLIVNSIGQNVAVSGDIEATGDFLFGDLGGGDWLLESNVAGNEITIGNASTKINMPGTLDPKLLWMSMIAEPNAPSSGFAAHWNDLNDGGRPNVKFNGGVNRKLPYQGELPVWDTTMTQSQSITTGQKCDIFGTLTIASGTLTISGTGKLAVHRELVGV